MKVLKRKNNLFTVALVCIVCSFGYSQKENIKSNADHIDTTKTELYIPLQSFLQVDYSLTKSDGVLLPKTGRHTMPIFCKWELDMMDKTRIPVKFRLGDVQYVDRLECK